jgi:hypothetical protein
LSSFAYSLLDSFSPASFATFSAFFLPAMIHSMHLQKGSA